MFETINWKEMKQLKSSLRLSHNPDRGRKKIITPTPVKVVALEHDIPVYQPEN